MNFCKIILFILCLAVLYLLCNQQKEYFEVNETEGVNNKKKGDKNDIRPVVLKKEEKTMGEEIHQLITANEWGTIQNFKSGATTMTQPMFNNSTNIATTEYVDRFFHQKKPMKIVYGFIQVGVIGKSWKEWQQGPYYFSIDGSRKDNYTFQEPPIIIASFNSGANQTTIAVTDITTTSFIFLFSNYREWEQVINVAYIAIGKTSVSQLQNINKIKNHL